MKKRIPAILLIALLLTGMLPVSTLAEEVQSQPAPSLNTNDYDEISAQGTWGEDLIWTLDAEGILGIFGTGSIPNSAAPWAQYRNSITSVVLSDGVTSIGNDAFRDYPALTSVAIPGSVTSIGGWAFLGCPALKIVAISDGVTSIGSFAFSDCTSLTSITIPDSVTSIGTGALYGCSKLASVTIPDGVTSIANSVFYRCSALTDLTIPDGVTSIGMNALEGCSKLASVTIPDSVTHIGVFAFLDCRNLTDVYYSGTQEQWKEISFTIGNDFLTRADIHFNASAHTHSYTDEVTAPTCTQQGYTTHTCECGDSYVDTHTDPVGHNWGEGVITTQPTETTEGVRTYTCATCGDTKTESVAKQEHTHSYTTAVTNPTCTQQGYTTHTCECGERFVDSYTAALGHNWGEGVITTPPTETTEGVRTYTCAACGTTKTEGYAEITAQGTWGENLTWTLDKSGTLTISGTGDMPSSSAPWNQYRYSITCAVVNDGVTSIGNYAFSDCTSLTSVTIPDSVTSIGHWAFCNCSALPSITIPDSVTSIGTASFKNCSSLTSIAIPDGVTAFWRETFANCTSLISVTIPDSVTAIGDWVFYNCPALTDLVIPDHVTSIEKYTFAGCSSLTSVTIPAGMTTIEEGLFQRCSELAFVIIPDSVTVIEQSAFSACFGLYGVYYSGTRDQWGSISIGDYNEYLTRADIHFGTSEHTHSYTTAVTNPTCIAQGYTTHTCECGDSYVDTYTDPLDHEWGNWYPILMPTETTPGKENHQCMNCELIETREIPALGHTHSYTAAVTNPACTEGGYTTYTCSCGDTYTANYVNAAGHKWGAWETLKEATQTQAGEEKRECSVCRKIEARVIPMIPSVTFSDVPEGAWFSAAVNWAVSNNVTSGTGNGTFSPDMACSRSQVVTFLWRAAGSPEPSGENPFADVTESAWYYKAVLWAVENGITTGTSADTFSPDMSCSRSQVVTFLYRATGSPEPSGENPFSDVTEGAWYYKAVLWAVENSITSGTTPTTFAPDMTCSRSQVVTFLYRAED